MSYESHLHELDLKFWLRFIAKPSRSDKPRRVTDFQSVLNVPVE